MRPARTYDGVPTPLASGAPVDMVVVRENSEGEYVHVGGRVARGTPDEVAVLIRSEKADGAALKRSAPTPTREGRGRREETASSGSDELRRSFRTFDERFLTPMFTLDRGEAEREGEGGE